MNESFFIEAQAGSVEMEEGSPFHNDEPRNLTIVNETGFAVLLVTLYFRRDSIGQCFPDQSGKDTEKCVMLNGKGLSGMECLCLLSRKSIFRDSNAHQILIRFFRMQNLCFQAHGLNDF